MLNKTDGKPELSRDHLHETVVLRALDLELHRAVNLGKQRVVTTHADVFAGRELRTALTNNDTAGAWESRPLRVEPPPFLCAIFLLS